MSRPGPSVLIERSRTLLRRRPVHSTHHAPSASTILFAAFSQDRRPALAGICAQLLFKIPDSPFSLLPISFPTPRRTAILLLNVTTFLPLSPSSPEKEGRCTLEQLFVPRSPQWVFFSGTLSFRANYFPSWSSVLLELCSLILTFALRLSVPHPGNVLILGPGFFLCNLIFLSRFLSGHSSRQQSPYGSPMLSSSPSSCSGPSIFFSDTSFQR